MAEPRSGDKWWARTFGRKERAVELVRKTGKTTVAGRDRVWTVLPADPGGGRAYDVTEWQLVERIDG